MFKDQFLARYFTSKTGYFCEIKGFDLNPLKSMIELHDVTIWNVDPYPKIPLAEVKRIRVEWDFRESFRLPRKLRLLEIEIDELTLIRLDGNQFNIPGFVEAIIRAWESSPETSDSVTSGSGVVEIGECWLYWDYLIAMDEEVKSGKRMEVLLDYEEYLQNVSRIHEITDPAIKTAKDQVESFYFFNYMGDSIRSLLK